MTHLLLSLVLLATAPVTVFAAGEPVVTQCEYLLANVTYDEIGPDYAHVAPGKALFRHLESPDHRPDRDVNFVFLANGRLAMSRMVYGDPISRFVDRIHTRVVTLDPDGTVRKQTLTEDASTSPILPTENWVIDLNQARLILGFARFHAGLGDVRLMEVVEMLAAELPAGSLD